MRVLAAVLYFVALSVAAGPAEHPGWLVHETKYGYRDLIGRVKAATQANNAPPHIAMTSKITARATAANPQATTFGSTSRQRIPSRAVAAAVCLAWFDCTPPSVMTVSTPSARASPSRYSSLRALFPPVARPVQSSRFTQISGPPSSALSRGSGSSGVGRCASRIRGCESRAAAKSAPGERTWQLSQRVGGPLAFEVVGATSNALVFPAFASISG